MTSGMVTPDDEHVGGARGRPTSERVLTAPDHEHRAGDDREPLHPVRLPTGVDVGDAADQSRAGGPPTTARAMPTRPVAPADRVAGRSQSSSIAKKSPTAVDSERRADGIPLSLRTETPGDPADIRRSGTAPRRVAGAG